MIRLSGVLIALSLSLNVWGGDDEDSDDWGCSRQPVNAMFVPDVSGQSLLCVRPGALEGKIMVKGLPPGDAFTVWWVYADDAGDCVSTLRDAGLDIDSQCGFAEFFGDKPVFVFGRMGSGVVSRRGRLMVQGTWGGMDPSWGSELWLLALGHGPASDDGDARARQTLTPEDPEAGAPHLGNEIDGPNFTPSGVSVFQLD